MVKASKILSRIALFFLRIYKMIISPVLFLFFGGSCRFQPTCSQYAQDSVNKHGVLKGSLLSTYRVLRCNPFNKGGYDPA